jgi:hypothetical protein
VHHHQGDDDDEEELFELPDGCDKRGAILGRGAEFLSASRSVANSSRV